MLFCKAERDFFNAISFGKFYFVKLNTMQDDSKRKKILIRFSFFRGGLRPVLFGIHVHISRLWDGNIRTSMDGWSEECWRSLWEKWGKLVLETLSISEIVKNNIKSANIYWIYRHKKNIIYVDICNISSENSKKARTTLFGNWK